MSFFETLLRASVQGALLAGLVWLVCRLAPRLPAGLRCALWWLVCLNLLLSLTAGLAGVKPVDLALLPADPPAAVARPATTVAASAPAVERVAAAAPAALAPAVASSRPELPDWRPILAGIWIAGLLVPFAATLFQLVHARGLVRRAERPRDSGLVELFEELRRTLGVGERAELRLSVEVRTPQVLGAFRPVVLLPRQGVASLTRADLSMALCHELLHVRRRDLWWGWVPALAQRLFYFHPLAALAAREYALAREAACDAEVLRVLDPAPEAYGRLLLRLGVTPRASRLAAAGAASSFETLKRRLQMLEQASRKKSRAPLAGLVLVLPLALVGLVPFRLTAAERDAPPAPPAPPAPVAVAAPAPAAAPAPPPALPVAAGQPVPAAPAPPAPAATPAPTAVVAPAPPPLPAVAPLLPGEVYARTAQAPPPPPVPPAPPTPPTPPRPVDLEDEGYDAWVIFHSGEKNSVTMSGSARDIRRAREHRKGDEGMIWIRRDDGKTYVIRDAAVVREAATLFERQARLGEQQAKLGAQQAELGGRQAELGGRQAAIGARQAALAARYEKHERDGKSTADYEAQQRELERQQEELGRQQDELGRQQDRLGEQQDKLGEQQDKLGREAEAKLAALLERAIRNGQAQVVK